MQNPAVRKIINFLLLTAIFSAFADRLDLLRRGYAAFAPVVWCPGAAAIITRLIYQQNLNGMGWGWGKMRYQLWSYGIPVLYGLAAYFIVSLAGTGKLLNPAFAHAIAREDIGPFGLANASPAVVLALCLVNSTVRLPDSCISALGEEIGWRGLLVPELAKVTSFTKTALFSGIVWSVWHYPLFFLGHTLGLGTWYSALSFTAMVIGMAPVLAWMRLKSGSVWPGMLLHASHNLFIQSVFDPLWRDTAITSQLLSESLVLAVLCLLVGYLFWRKRGDLPARAESAMA